MEMLTTFISTYQQHSSAVADNDEDRETINTSVRKLHAEGVASPQEEDLHAAKAAHEKVYSRGNADEASDEELGQAAGVEAFHEYKKSEAESEGGGQGQLIQMAMAEGMKIFSSGGGSDKGAVIQSAIAMAMKLFMGASGSASGGVSQLMSMFGGSSGGSGGSGQSSGMGGMLSMLGENPQVAGMLKQFM